VRVRVRATVQHTTVQIVGTIRTNGGHGDVSYRRRDGRVCDHRDAAEGRHSVRVPLRWTIK
jgi:hypothetical protein